MPRVKLSYGQIKELREVLEAAPHLKQLHFTADGTYYVNAYPFAKEGETEKKLYGRVGLLHNAANKSEAIVDQFLIVKSFTREEILADGFDGTYDEPAAAEEEKAPGAPAPTAEDLAAGEQKDTVEETRVSTEAFGVKLSAETPAPEPEPEAAPVKTPEAATAPVEHAPAPEQAPSPESPTEIHPSQQN